MLFNSYKFIFIFFPCVAFIYYLIGKFNSYYSSIWLSIASLFFYYIFSNNDIYILIFSILLNYSIRQYIYSNRGLLIIAVIINLGLLSYFKYLNLILNTFNYSGTINVVLPIGISFFTFTQIAFLVDSYYTKIEKIGVLDYILFVTYFPHLIAGPIIHHGSMMPQFKKPDVSFKIVNFNIGITIFIIGLSKKLLIADPLSKYADFIFLNSDSVNVISAWVGVLAYTFQIYFDFSGYCDMAIGISKILNINLPINFDSPYKAKNIIDFWRRWHITLSSFLRDYLYIPMGGGKKGKSRKYFNLIITMLLGGIWHGSNWNFLLWGGLHGLYLYVNHSYTYLISNNSIEKKYFYVILISKFSWLITFISVVFSWVLFRAATVDDALNVYSGMLGLKGVVIPESLNKILPNFLENYFNFGQIFLESKLLPNTLSLFEATFLIGLSIYIVLCGKNSNMVPNIYNDLINKTIKKSRTEIIYPLTIGIVFSLSLLSLSKNSPFLYFQF